jgi:demethylspheroidene O-methyltransferase
MADLAAHHPTAPVRSWRDRILDAKDRLLASPRFQRWAVSFPLTRPIARRRASALFDLCAGFVYSQVLAACVRLRLLEALAEEPQTCAALAERLSLPVEGASRLLAAAAALDLVARRSGERFALGKLGAALLGNRGVAAMVEHHAFLYADLRDPVALLRGGAGQGEVAGYWPYSGATAPRDLSAADVGPYSALMAASQSFIADEILGAYRFDRHRRLLDVGGGEGAFVIAAAARAPGLQLMSFDLPAVADRASRRFAAAGLDGRAVAIGGDFLADALPAGADIVTLVRVLHDHDDPVVSTILSAVHAALPAGGVLIVGEPMSGTPGGAAMADAYFGFYLLAMGHGRARTDKELENLLHAAGFGRVARLKTRTPMFCRVLLARKA